MLTSLFETELTHAIYVFRFLTQCRPLSVSMGNAIKYLKLQITQIPPSMSEKQVSMGFINARALTVF